MLFTGTVYDRFADGIFGFVIGSEGKPAVVGAL